LYVASAIADDDNALIGDGIASVASVPTLVDEPAEN
jgi:hypothetical protein